MASRRKEIVEFVVGQLKNIDGGCFWVYNHHIHITIILFNNVFRKLKFLDEVNDFPALYVSAGTEIRELQF